MNIDSRYVMTMSNFLQLKYQEVSALTRFGYGYHLPGCLICVKFCLVPTSIHAVLP